MRVAPAIIAAAGLSTVALSTAQAQITSGAGSVCVTVDEKTDTLAPGERAAAKALAETSFQSAGVSTTAAPCAVQYTISNIRLGEAVVVTMAGPGGVRKGKAATLSELDAVYDQMVRSLVKGEDEAVSRTNVTAAQAQPKRVRADSLWHINIGTGYVTGSDVSEVPLGLGFGYRYELDKLGIDATARLFISAGNDGDGEGNGEDGAVNGGFRLMALYHFDGLSSSSPYVGGGLGWGGTAAVFDDDLFSGGGLEGHLAAGYSLLRESSIRMYLQFDAVMPFYNLEHDLSELSANGVKQDDRYAPIFGISLGVGWSRD